MNVGQPQQPQLGANATPEQIKSIVEIQNKQQQDGLLPLSSKLQEVISDIGQISGDMRDSFNALYKTYNDAVDDRIHALTDISTAVDASKNAAVSVAQKEQELEGAKKFAAEAEEKRQEAEEKRQEAEKKFEELKSQQQELQKKARDAVDEATKLQQRNKQLVDLHQSQIVNIHTNIQTLATLKDELNKLHSGIKNLHQQAVALGCIKLFTHYPLLIKARRIALNSQNIINTGVSPITEEYIKSASRLLLPIIVKSLEESKSKIEDIIQHLKAVSPPQPPPAFPFWENYLRKVEDTKTFLTGQVLNGYTWLEFLVYCWTIENLPLPNVDQAVKEKIEIMKTKALAEHLGAQQPDL